MTGPATLKRTPLIDLHQELGGKIVPFAGWSMPIQFAGVIEEHLCVREKAGLPETDRANREVADFIASHPRGKHGQIVYHLERDFGISPEELRKRFDFYFEAFPKALRPVS